MDVNNSYNQRKEVFIWVFLIASWAIIQVILYSHSGVKTGYDSAFYIDNAHALLRSAIPEERGIWYISYSAFLGVFISLGIPLSSAVAVQIILSFIALVLLYKIAKELSGDKNAGLIAAFLYVFWTPLQEWNVFLYTESLFTSCLIISFWTLLKVKKPKDILLFLPLLVFTLLIRPTGLSFLLALSAYCGIIMAKQQRNRTYKMITVFFLATLCFILTVLMLESYDFIPSYIKAEIIYPNINLGIQPPDNLSVLEGNHLNIVKLGHFIFHNPIYFAKIGTVKLLLFFGNIKPYFSLTHNLLIILFLYPIYVFAYNAYRKLLDRTFKPFFAVYILVQGLIVMLTSENWDGRFLIPVLPFVFILASMDIGKHISMLKEKRIK